MQVRVPPLPDAPAPGEQKAGLSDRDVAYARSLVLYEDEEVLALNKPSGLAVQGGTKTTKHVDRLLSAWGEGGGPARGWCIGWDRDTLRRAAARQDPGRRGQVVGRLRQAAGEEGLLGHRRRQSQAVRMGVIELHLVKKGVGDREIVVPADPKEFGAETAETEFVTVARAAHRAAWMALQPHTGRTHQLRAHMKAIGHTDPGRPQVLRRGVGGALRCTEIAPYNVPVTGLSVTFLKVAPTVRSAVRWPSASSLRTIGSFTTTGPVLSVVTGSQMPVSRSRTAGSQSHPIVDRNVGPSSAVIPPFFPTPFATVCGIGTPGCGCGATSTATVALLPGFT